MSYNISLTLKIIYLKIISKEFFNLLYFSRNQVISIYKFAKIIVINKKDSFKFIVFWIVMQSLKNLNMAKSFGL